MMTSPSGSSAIEPGRTKKSPAKVLLVDDETRFRKSLATRLGMRGYDVQAVGDGEEALRRVRRAVPDVVVLDRRMPGMSGEEVLRELKKLAPELQVIMLTGHGSIESATETGRLDAFAYLTKPCEMEQLVTTIEAARQEKLFALARHQLARVESKSWLARAWGTSGARPGVLLLGGLLFAAGVLAPAPASLRETLSVPRPTAAASALSDAAAGESLAGRYLRRPAAALTPGEVDAACRAAQVVLALLLLVALFWVTNALPLGVSALLVAVVLYLFDVFPPARVAQVFVKDAVIFVAAMLALSMALNRSGLDKRLGLALLAGARTPARLLFVFWPLLAVTASFVSEHLLLALLAPVLVVIYQATIRTAGIKRDHGLVVVLVLGTCLVANQGGLGTPAGGGRNAAMIGLLADYGPPPSFWDWVSYGLPVVPLIALAIAAYFYLIFGRRLGRFALEVVSVTHAERAKLGRLTKTELITAAVLAGVLLFICLGSERFGLGGPALLGVVVLAVTRVIAWRDINQISWDVVLLYAAACALGAGLVETGAGVWLGQAVIEALPQLSLGSLCIGASLLGTVLTNIMPDGAAVATLGPVVLPTAAAAGVPLWPVGMVTSFSASFANCLIIATPTNAIVYSLARDLDTGEQLVTQRDFLIHGGVVTLLALGCTWGVAVFGYWTWLNP